MKTVKILSSVAFLAMLSGACASADDDPVADVTVSIDSPATIAMEEGSEVQLSASASDGSAILWSTTDTSVATVTDGGMLKAKAYGATRVTAAAGKAKASRLVMVKGYTLVWSDEFEKDGLDLGAWNVETGGNGWGNNEKQYYTGREENLRTEGGCLVIEARKEKYEGSSYTSARITTKEKASFTYGKIEARMKLPAGGGTWPAFWMLGYGSWPYCGEIDIMEHVGNDPNMISHALHTAQANGSNGRNWYSQARGLNVEGEWHTYGVEWLQNYQDGRDIVIFTIDGEATARKIQSPNAGKDSWPFNDQFFIILNMAIGGNMGGTVNDDIFDSEVKLLVDYVRVYQKKYPIE